ncbi:MAG: preprotein translocase subunit SecY [Bdellovibrionaceae bacterium]|nr:preprotein translocase subunit SecY [Pseudobdellovibrionaceae bacterium]
MSVVGILNNNDLRKKILFTLVALSIYRIGVHVPTPGVDSKAVMDLFNSNATGILSFFNSFTGGALSQFSIFALGIMPYISSSIIFQLLSSALPQLESLKKEGESGRKKITQYTRYFTLVLAIIQGFGMSKFLLSQRGPGGGMLVTSPFVGVLPFELVAVLTLTAGTCFIMWLGEQITERGIGNGSSLIIFTGIASAIPSGAHQLWTLFDKGEVSFIKVLLLLLLMIGVIAFVIFMETAQRRLTINYSQRNAAQNNRPVTSHLPIKINYAGVIPPIFASSILMFPATIAQFSNIAWLRSIQETLNPNGVFFNIIFVLLIVFFSFFYTDIIFNPNEISDNLKKSGAFVPGVRSGSSTSVYIQEVLNKINVLGCVYLSFICIMPGLFTSQLNLPFYFGGTSLLILVGVALDTAQQINSYILTQKYEGFLKGKKITSRRVSFN